ncbi:MAG: HAMP domain-containing histidine kinase [Coriobacteriia bacterium]|nr:HAMP domain-containing histidine kinase [Coriobacteriia bacterium]
MSDNKNSHTNTGTGSGMSANADSGVNSDTNFVVKVLHSTTTKVVALTLGFFAAVALVRWLSISYDSYMSWAFGKFLELPLPVALFSFVACAAVFFVSVWLGQRGPKREAPSPLWRKYDVFALAVLAYSVIIFSRTFVMIGGVYGFSPFALTALSLLSYAVVMFLLSNLLANVRNKRLQQTFYWLRFFKLYTLEKPIGILMALLLVISLILHFHFSPFNVIGDFTALDFGGNIGLRTAPLMLYFVIMTFVILALSYVAMYLVHSQEKHELEHTKLLAEYDKANEEKLQAERFKTELITNVSHDIKTPLTSLVNYIDLMKGLPVDNNDFDTYLDVLDRKSVRLKTLIDDLMEATKAGTGSLRVNLEALDLTEIVGQIVGEFEEPFAERHLTLASATSQSQPVMVQADSRHLWRVLENIFSNVSKYALPKTRVFVEIVPPTGGKTYGEAGVETGGGASGVFAEATLKNSTSIILRNTSEVPIDLPSDALTEQFIRGDRARKTEGSGLGLYIAKSLMELMGGELVIRAVGDLFEVELLFDEA